MEDFESLTGFVLSGSSTPLTLNSAHVRTASSLKITPHGVTGFSPYATKADVGTFDPTLAGMVVIAVHVDAICTPIQLDLAFGVAGSYYSSSSQRKQTALPPGWYWHCFSPADMTGLPSGVATVGLRPRLYQNAPFDGPLSVDACYRNAKGRPTIILTFDDTYDTQYGFVFPLMQSYGMKGTAYISPDRVGTFGLMTLANVQAMAAAGWDIGVGTTADKAFTAFADPATAVADLSTNRSWLVANGLDTPGKDHTCYSGTSIPGGGTYHDITPAMKQIAALTSDGSDTVVAGVAPGVAVAVGDTLMAYGAPAGTRVLTVNSTTSFKMDQTIPARVVAAAFQDQSGAFFFGKVPTALKASGFIKTARAGTSINQRNALFTRFGLLDHDVFMPSTSFSGASPSTLKSWTADTITYGETRFCVIHGVTPAGGGLNVSESDFTDFIADLAAKKAAGLIDVMTVSQFYTRDGSATPP